MKSQYEYVAKDEHIDVQGIMDGLFYAFYMELGRHRYVNEVLGYDLAQEAAKGINIVLTQSTIKFRRPLRRGDRFTVSCEAHPDASGKPRFHLVQEMTKDNKVVTEGLFSATFVNASGGRSFLPEGLIEKLSFSIPIDLA